MWPSTLAGFARHFLRRTKQETTLRAIAAATTMIMIMEESDTVVVDMALMEMPVLRSGSAMGGVEGGDGVEGWLGG